MRTGQATLHRLVLDLRGRAVAVGDRGASLVEYALLVTLIAMVCFGAVQLLGGATGDSISDSASRIGSTVG